VDPVGRVQLRDQDGAVSLADPDGDRHRMGAEGGEGLEQTSFVSRRPTGGRPTGRQKGIARRLDLDRRSPIVSSFASRKLSVIAA
jgi:hypothetical protein